MVLGDLDSYIEKNEIQTPTYTTHQNKFKVDKRLTSHHKSHRGEHRQDNLKIFHAIIFSLICPLKQGT